MIAACVAVQQAARVWPIEVIERSRLLSQTQPATAATTAAEAVPQSSAKTVAAPAQWLVGTRLVLAVGRDAHPVELGLTSVETALKQVLNGR